MVGSYPEVETTYNSAAGPVLVERSLYWQKRGGRRHYAPLNLRVGMDVYLRSAAN